MMVLSIGAVSAEDADDAIASSDDNAVLEDSESTISGTVSGGVDVVTENPDKVSGELSYDIPDDAKTIKSADVYVNVYGVTTDDRYGANVNTTIKTANGDTRYNESLCFVNDEDDHSIVHNVNDHVTKVYLNYMIHYDIKNLVTGLNGTKLTINVDSFKMENKSFDGRIKLIALVLAYNGNSADETISYWVNDNQLWTKSNVTLVYNTIGKSGISTLTNVVLSSSDGSYKLNGEFLGDADKHVTGSTYQYNQWDVTRLINRTKDTTLNVAASGNGQWGSIRNSLSVLTINDIKSSISLSNEYSNVAFAGTNNTLSVNVNASKAGKYIVRLLADNNVVDEKEVSLNNNVYNLLLTDPTIRAVDETTVYGAANKKVNYTVELVLDGTIVNSTTISLPILYNGNLGKDLAYPSGGLVSLDKIIINGDIVIDAKDVSTRLPGTDPLRNKTDVWTVNLDENSTIVKSFIYVPYNWFNPNLATEDINMFNATFNGVNITPVTFYRDQGNLGGYGNYGYGVVIYDVTALINKSGDNSLFLSRAAKYPALYPSVLVYMYNTTNSDIIKEIYINEGADLLGNSTSAYTNLANRTSKLDSTFNVYSKVTSNATLYVFASNALPDYGSVIFNGEEHKNVWNGASSCTIYYELDVTNKLKDSNSVSVVAAGKGNILALQQIMVLTKNLNDVEITLVPEYTSVPSAYAGTNNAITITIESLKAGKFNATLFADGVKVNMTEVDLIAGTNKFVIIDPTIRAVDESTVNGVANKKVNYTLALSSGKNATISIPVLYNGNLGKDLAYPAGGIESFLNITINGDIVIDIKDVGTYLGTSAMNRNDVWTVNLDSKSSFVKSFIYVPYNWFNPNLASEDLNMFNATFNGVKVVPIAMYRDQGNLGTYGRYGYGLLVYDVTNLIKTGENSFNLTKLAKTPAVYPSVLVYMYNTTGSAVVRNVYISNGADLLAGTSNNVAGREVKSDSTINVAAIADTAKLYIFAASAQDKEGNIVFNGVLNENVWSGTSSTTDLFTLDITNSVKNTNNISFVATGSTIVALQQIIVTTQKAPTAIAAPAVTTVYNTNKNLVVTLKDSNGNAVANAQVTIVLNGAKKVLNTNANGQATLAIPSNLVPKTYSASISFDGDANYLKSTASAKVIVKKANVKLTAKKATFKAKKKSKKYSVVLKNNKGKAMKKVKLTLKVKGKTYKATTNAKGKATFNLKKLTKKGKYTAKVTYKGDKYFNKSVKKVKITVKK